MKMKMKTECQGMTRAAAMLLLAALLPFADAVVAGADTGNNLEKPGWKLTFHDEFDGTQLDRSKWDDKYWDGRTHSNNELEYYAPDGYEVAGSRLRLKGERRLMAGHDYTSGMISSFGHFAQQYGYFEIRAKFPKGKGFWPAFWLLPANKHWPPEIDILEILGHEPTKVYFTNHWLDAAGVHRQHVQSFTGPDLSADYHTFAIDWEPGAITWYLDGAERAHSTAGVPAEPMYVIANLAVGGDWPGNPDAATPFPGFMDIDYIRVYQKAGS
jgi:beta-glucanase (GH16 family)